jgi:hypothetical protein
LEPSDGAYAIGEREVAEISGYCEIAKANRSAITVRELLELTRADATEEELVRAWGRNAEISARYALESGYVLERGAGGEPLAGGVEVEETNRARARSNVLAAKDFARLCADGRVRLLAVSGGNSYKSARQGDDIDLFCVTGRDALWVFMLKSLLLARLYRITRRCAPFCFSYVMDEADAGRTFAETRDALFARDALTAEVLVGRGFYRSLLEKGSWMGGFFPRMYARGLTEAVGPARSLDSARGTGRALNALLYRTVGTYVRMKAYLLNRRYRSALDTPAVFRVLIGPGHCIYESNRYDGLRRMYEGRRRRPTTSAAAAAAAVPSPGTDPRP